MHRLIVLILAINKIYKQNNQKKLCVIFLEKDICAIIVHLDRKLLPSLTNKDHVDRLLSVINSYGNKQLPWVIFINTEISKNKL